MICPTSERKLNKFDRLYQDSENFKSSANQEKSSRKVGADLS